MIRDVIPQFAAAAAAAIFNTKKMFTISYRQSAPGDPRQNVAARNRLIERQRREIRFAL
jgi:hypothetical protein